MPTPDSTAAARPTLTGDAEQRRTVRVLALGQMLGALAYGTTISIGALLAAHISGSESLSGLAVASLTLGAALAAMPLAAFAHRRGRRWSLGLGNAVALVGIAVVLIAAGLANFPLLLAGYLLIGSGNAGNLQARFAATDLASPERRARDLSRVVWATTVGAVIGPNLQAPGQIIAHALGMPEFTGAYVFAVVAQLGCLAVFGLALRPDPLLRARERADARQSNPNRVIERVDRPILARFAILAVAASHGVMVAVMSMTPVHLEHEGATLSLIGVTISLHVAGMYAVSPVFGWLADRFGKLMIVVFGQLQLALSLTLIVIAPDDPGIGVAALILLGTGWSAGTVAGSALLSEASSLEHRTRRQGRSDAIMSATGALSAIAAGGVLAVAGYGGLAAVSFILVALVLGGVALVSRGSRPAVTSAAE